MFEFAPGAMQIVGSVGTGKTNFCLKLIENSNSCFQCKPQEILFFYERWQDAYEKYKKKVHFRQGLPTDLPADCPKLVILDDVGDDAAKSKELLRMAACHARHSGTVLVIVTHNLYSKEKFSTDFANCLQYLVLWENVRYQSQIRKLAQQTMPGDVDYFMDAYDQAVKRYGYLLFDLTPKKDHRLLSDVFSQNPAYYTKVGIYKRV